VKNKMGEVRRFEPEDEESEEAFEFIPILPGELEGSCCRYVDSFFCPCYEAGFRNQVEDGETGELDLGKGEEKGEEDTGRDVGGDGVGYG
jgi:hypothetical protein